MASRKWRIQGVDSGGVDLILSRVAPWGQSGAVAPSAIACTFAPVSGNLDNLLVNDSTQCIFAAADVRQPGFAIELTFTAPVDLWGFRFSGPSENNWLLRHTLSADSSAQSVDGVRWVNGGLSPAPSRQPIFTKPANEWGAQETPGTRNWRGCAISADAKTLIGAAFGGNLWLSKDAGVTWVAQAAAGSRDWRGGGVSADGQTILWAAGSSTLWLSKDGGTTWGAQTAPGTQAWYAAAVSADGQTLLGAALSGTLWLSKDAGVTWASQSAAGTRSWYDCAVSADGLTLVGAAAGGMLWLSRDGGSTWSAQTNIGARNWYSCAVSADGQTLIGAVRGEDLWLSKDAGATWLPQNTMGLANWYDCATSADGQILMGAVDSGLAVGLWLSKDAGTTWAVQPMEGYREWYGCATSANGQLVMGAAYTSSLWLMQIGDPIYLPLSRAFGRTDVATFASSAPLEQGKMPMQKVAVVDRLLDAEFGGFYRIYGTVARKGTPANVPLKRRVRLHRSKDGMLVRETWSKADGSYEFTEISGRYEYDVIAWDHEMSYRSVVANNLTPEAM